MVLILLITIVCQIIVLITIFRHGGIGKGIAAAVIPLYAFIWGWLNARQHGLLKAMIVWSVAVVLFFAMGMPGSMLFYYYHGRAEAKEPTTRKAIPFQTVRTNQLTFVGDVLEAAISPDGKFVVYARDEAGQQSLWIRRTAVAGDVRLMPPAKVQYFGVTWSPNGSLIYYTESDVLYQIPMLGGSAKKLVENVYSRVTVSPDGRRLAFFRNEEKEITLIVVNADGTGEQRLTLPKRYDSSVERISSPPSWSPKGGVILYSVEVAGAGAGLVGIRMADGSRGNYVKPGELFSAASIESITWRPDESGVVVTAQDQASSPRQIWLISISEGKAQRITNNSNDYRAVTTTADASVLAAVQSDLLSSAKATPDANAKQTKQVKSDVVLIQDVR